MDMGKVQVCTSQENGAQAGKFDGKHLMWATQYKGIARAETKWNKTTWSGEAIQKGTTAGSHCRPRAAGTKVVSLDTGSQSEPGP